jgi:hypothetical protein
LSTSKTTKPKKAKPPQEATEEIAVEESETAHISNIKRPKKRQKKGR